MRIAIDGSAIPRQRAGAGVYTFELVRALAKTASEHEIVVFGRQGVFDELAAEHATVRAVHVEPTSRPARLVWEQTALPAMLERLDVDVLHSPHHHTPFLPAVGTRRFRRVVTFHDVTFLLLPGRYQAVRRLYMASVTRAAARVADAIITPSDTIRADVMRTLGVAGERIVAIPEAAGPQYAPVEDEDALGKMRWRLRLPNAYILSVGSLEPGKNRGRLLLAYARLRKEGLEAPLVIAGQPAWNYEGDEKLIEALGLGKSVRFLGYVPNEDMPALYSGATLLAFPSLYEGFGLPVLEAMACGTPVVTSTGSATEEAAGDAALLVDPRDVDGLTEALGRVLSDEGLRADLRERGLARAKQFSWERAAKETLAVYESAAGRD